MKALLLIYALGTLSDYATTAWGLARGAVERNPFALSLIEKHGIEALLWFKVAGIVIAALTMWLICRVSRFMAECLEDDRFYAGLRRFAFGWFYLLTLLQWLVVAWNLGQMRIAMALGL